MCEDYKRDPVLTLQRDVSMNMLITNDCRYEMKAANQGYYLEEEAKPGSFE